MGSIPTGSILFVFNQRRCIFKELLDLINKAEAICSDERISWETKYHVIFKMGIQEKIRETWQDFDWYDPDTSHEEDVTAFMRAVLGMKEELETLVKHLDD